jgi:hypothetical protein
VSRRLGEASVCLELWIASSDESDPSWLEPGLELNNFQLGSARDLFHSARKFPY